MQSWVELHDDGAAQCLVELHEGCLRVGGAS